MTECERAKVVSAAAVRCKLLV